MHLALTVFMLGSALYVPTDTPCPEDCVLSASYASEEIRIDGILDEEVWLSAAAATNFTQYSPHEGEPATQQTEVRILYGQSQLFISATLRDTDPEGIRRILGRRDEFNQADWFIASIDSYFDRKTSYNFAVNAAGVQADGIYTGNRFHGGGGFDFDTSWNAVWKSAVRRTEEGWIVEMRIPFTMLRFSDTPDQHWGINFRRVIPRLGEVSDWVLIPRAERSSGTVAQYGTLEGIIEIRPRRNIQVTPYTVGNTTRDSEARSSSFSGDVGADFKVGLSSNITLDATINPDFGQVEADPAELNLTAFETFFPEKRPFFTEGIAVFNYDVVRGGSLLYTRRIGSRAPVLGATKLSGRTEKGLDFGFFGASTGDNFNPENLYGVGRVLQRIGSLSSFGGIATFYDDNLGGRSYTGGTDWDIRFADNQYSFSGQLSAAHRMSDDDLERGFAFTTSLDRQRSIWNFSADLVVISNGYNPNDIGRLRQDNYANLSGGIFHQVNGGQPFGPFRRASFFFFGGGGFSYDKRLHNGVGTFFRSDWTTHGYSEIELGIQSDYLFGGYNEFETRGLEARARPLELEFELGYTTDTRRKWMLQPELQTVIYGDGGRGLGSSLELEWVATPKLNLSLEVGLEREFNTTEWAANEAISLPPDSREGYFWQIGEDSGREPSKIETWRPMAFDATLNNILSERTPWDEERNHFVPVYGHRNTRAADITLRTGITLSPTLAIQFYGQLFAARGQYDDFLLLQDRDTLVPIAAWPKQYDFAFSRFQTNTVLRWEYHPGSVLYLVWTQSRSGRDDSDIFNVMGDSPFDQSTSSQLTDTFGLPPLNVLLVKFSYKFLN